MVKPTVISLFAGTGGSSLGYKWAGYKELLAIDFDQHAVSCFKLNFPKVPVWNMDISKVKCKKILNFCDLKAGELDVLDGSPPCQGFSTAGKRDLNDDRNDLFKEYVRMIKGLKPKVFVMENVTGMTKGRMKGKFIEIMKTLKALNYTVKCKQMNSMYYNVPQSRERLIFIGVRKDLKALPRFPKPNKKIITVKEALKGVKNKCFSKDIKGYWQEKIYPKFYQGQVGLDNQFFNISRLAWDKISPTICKSTTYAGFSSTIHPDLDRDITIEECMRLSSFPDDFKLIGTYPEKWARIGNSVMPRFMEKIALKIKEILSGLK